ncbi:hypothetical protein AVDCRST_MAG94-314 [uncultured Leptolyngbya sp.]|uniref:Uncharacterized protein n=1 Tax=uncultured Leptolyngbya sp. TaxID=332963 RepID=A0A6J4KB27_9CYAN|nr:hypothetical protein AVDCRST_MAG94-314 [uncultured Leptolyngbya sp.]
MRASGLRIKRLATSHPTFKKLGDRAASIEAPIEGVNAGSLQSVSVVNKNCLVSTLD